ncbi:HAD hydrolase-like protein [Myxococcota bacterium]|nr:HAD hydrolase-like protein [Myxococcota bacterium]MBU1380563.1 HAD hydrolase-like protein [Myxococcota bacterium]MBU1497887.1 HAD hydrolase-like protein [Myxococcota bacterium]
MTQEPFGFLLFDIDGTLLTAGGAGRKSIEEAVTAVISAPWDSSSIRLHGNTDRSVFQEISQVLPESLQCVKTMDTLINHYFQRLDFNLVNSNCAMLYPGVFELLEQIHAIWNISLLTGNFRKSAFIKLRACGIDHFFEDGGFADDGFSRTDILASYIKKRSIPPGKAILIGDTPWDAQAALNCGIKSIGVSNGRFSIGELSDSGFNLVFETMMDLSVKLIEELLSND